MEVGAEGRLDLSNSLPQVKGAPATLRTRTDDKEKARCTATWPTLSKQVIKAEHALCVKALLKL